LGFGRSRLVQALAAKGGRWRRALWLLAGLAALILVAAAAFQSSPESHARLGLLIAALKDPMALLSERSPGFRIGPLIPIKGKGGPRERVLSSVRDRPRAGPHERVLASARDRPPVAAAEDTPPVVLDMPVVVDIPTGAFFTPAAPTQAFLPPDQLVGSLFTPVTPFNYTVPGFTPGETPPPLVATATPDVPSTPGSPSGPSVPPTIIASNPPVTPPGITPGTNPETPQGSTPVVPPGGGPIILPEPSTWSMMILGLLAIGFVLRRNRKPVRQ